MGQASHDFHVSTALVGMAVKFGLLGERMGGIESPHFSGHPELAPWATAC